MGPRPILFGEVAVLDGQDRTAERHRREPTELFVLRPRGYFLGHLEREPKVAIKIIMLLCPADPLAEGAEWRVHAAAAAGSTGAGRLCALGPRSISARKVHISQEQLAYSSAPHAKASTVSCSSGARRYFGPAARPDFSCRHDQADAVARNE